MQPLSTLEPAGGAQKAKSTVADFIETHVKKVGSVSGRFVP